jgi:RNA 3'-phosphate cyclase
MIEIDGVDGGGQVLRTAISLSAITNEPVRVFNIRKGKDDAQPGLRMQHMAGIDVMKDFTDAEVKGLAENSLEIEFHPKRLALTDADIDIGSAGSITLLLQTLLPAMAAGDKKVQLKIRGGTETNWSPTIQYFQDVTLNVLKGMGLDAKLEIEKHGYYPKGGGTVIIRSSPAKLRAIRLLQRGQLKGIHVESVCGNLQAEIAKRQAESAVSMLKYRFPNGNISASFKRVDSESAGTSVTCHALFENTVLGGSALGGRGITSESVGISAAEDLLHSMMTGACLDRYMSDQILIFMALAKGESEVRVREITGHCITNIRTIERMLPVKFKVQGEPRKEGIISVKGIGE